MRKFKRRSGNMDAEPDNMPEPKKKMSRQMIYGIFIIAIMSLSVIGYVSTDFLASEKYNGFPVKPLANGRWSVRINGNNILFYSHPSQVENIEDKGNAIGMIKDSGAVYFTSDPDDRLKDAIGAVEYDLMDMISKDQKNKIDMIYAFTKQNEFEKPVITCANATSFIPVVRFKQGDTKISVSSNCIIVSVASEYDFAKIRDRIIYGFYDVIKMNDTQIQ